MAPNRIRLVQSVARRVAAQAMTDRVPLLAAGVAFYAMLAVVPALVAAVSLYGLAADPAQIHKQVQSATRGLPPDARNLIAGQLYDLATSQSSSGLGVSSALGILATLWSASAGMRHLIDALNAANGQTERRGFVRLRVHAYLLTAGAVIFAAVAAGFLAVLPAALRHTQIRATTRLLMNVIRFPVLAVAMMVGLSILYRFGPDHDEPEWRWATWGAGTATAIWLVGSGLFALYVSTLGRFNEVYGSLGAVVVLMLWLLLTAASVLIGAEVDQVLSEVEA